MLLPFFFLPPPFSTHLAIFLFQITLGLSASLGSLLAGLLLAHLRRHLLVSRLLCQVSLLLSASVFLTFALLPFDILSKPPLLLIASSVLGLAWGVHRTGKRVLVWRSFRSRFLLADSALQTSQAVPLILIFCLASLQPRYAAFASTTSLIISFLLLLLLPGNKKAQRRCKEKLGAVIKMESSKEDVFDKICQKKTAPDLT